MNGWIIMKESKVDRFKNKLGNKEAKNLNSLINNLKNSILDFQDNISIMISGEFNAGKSTFINALLGEEILTTDVTPATAIITKLTHGEERKVLAHYMDNSIVEYETDWVEQLTAERKGLGESIRAQLSYVEYQLPIEILKKYTLIDSPGLGTLYEHHTKITEAFIKRADIGIWLFNSLSVGTATEIAWLKKLNALDLPIYGIVNAIDRIEDDELDFFMEDNNRRLRPYVKKLFAMSAIDILNGKLNQNIEELSWGNNQAVEELFLEFDSNHLFKMKSLYSNLNDPLKDLVKLLQEKKDYYNLADNNLGMKKLDMYYMEFEYHKNSVERLKLQTDDLVRRWRIFIKANKENNQYIKDILYKIGNSEDLLLVWEQQIQKKYNKYIRKHKNLSEEYEYLTSYSAGLEKSWKESKLPILRLLSKLYFLPTESLHNKAIRRWNAKADFLDLFNGKFRKSCKAFNNEIEKRINIEFDALKSEWNQISIGRESFQKDFMEEYKNIETYKVEKFHKHYENVQQISRLLMNITNTNNIDFKNMNSYKKIELSIQEINSLYQETDYLNFVEKLLEMRTTNIENQFSRSTSLEYPIFKMPDDFSNQKIPEINLKEIKTEKNLKLFENENAEKEPLQMRTVIGFFAVLGFVFTLIIFMINSFNYVEENEESTALTEEIYSSESIAVSPEEQEEEIKTFMQSYRIAYQEALNEEEFYHVSDYLDNQSQAYNDMTKAIDSIKGKGLIYTFLSTEITDIKIIEDDRFILRTEETYSLYNSNDGSESSNEKSKDYSISVTSDGAFSIEEIKEVISTGETVSLVTTTEVEEMVSEFYADLVFAINGGAFSSVQKYYVKDSDYYNSMEANFSEESFQEILDMNNNYMEILSINVYDNNHYAAVIHVEDEYLYKSMKGATNESQIEFLIEVMNNNELKIVEVLNEEVLAQTEF